MTAVQGPAWNQLWAAAGNRTPPVKDQLAAIVLDNYWLGHEPSGTPFAVSQREATAISFPIDDAENSLCKRIGGDYYDLTGQAASREHRKTAADLAAVIGRQSGLSARTWLRSAPRPDGAVVLDLGRPDGVCAVVGPGGWELTDQPRVLFRRSNRIKPLPNPVSPPGGKLPPAVRQLVNISSEDEWSVLIACRVAALMPRMTRPVEVITGQPGTAKTGTTNVLVQWTGGNMTTSELKDPRDWAAAIKASRTVGLDNVSSISARASDLLCKAATGSTFDGRMLFSNGDLYESETDPVSVIINGVELGALRGDLVSRSVTHRLSKPEKYLPEDTVDAWWAESHAGALGWLLDVTAWVMGTEVPGAGQGHRLAGFGAVLAAIDMARGTAGLESWLAGQAEAHTDAADADPLALALRLRVQVPWMGTAGQLLDTLGMMPDNYGAWTPRRLASRLERVQLALESDGWKISRSHIDRRTKRWVWNIVPPSGQ